MAEFVIGWVLISLPVAVIIGKFLKWRLGGNDDRKITSENKELGSHLP